MIQELAYTPEVATGDTGGGTHVIQEATDDTGGGKHVIQEATGDTTLVF